MESKVLLVRNNKITSIPQQVWQSHITEIPEHTSERLAFMSDDHHRVRNFVVKELPRFGHPITLEDISSELALTPDRTNMILEDLEQRLFFLVRDDHGAVAWAYPLTVESTPHKLLFNNSEQLYAA